MTDDPFRNAPNSRKRWCREDDDYLRTWGYMGTWHMAMDLARSMSGVRRRAKALKIGLGRNACAHDTPNPSDEKCTKCGAPYWPIHHMTAEWDAEG